MRLITPSFYSQDTITVARELIGKILASNRSGERISGRIVETEAYLGALDEASHSYNGRTERNKAMFGPPGTLYVYFTYGMHYCMNVVTAAAGTAEAVLIRAVEPLEGIDEMSERRGVSDTRNLCSGPAKLVQAFGVTKADNGLILQPESGLWIEEGERMKIVSGPRVGISRAVEAPLRFWAAGNPYISRTPKRQVQ
jgi:DNA-3-methyladenine glycosylase